MGRQVLTYSNHRINIAYNWITRDISEIDEGYVYSFKLKYEKYKDLMEKYIDFIKE